MLLYECLRGRYLSYYRNNYTGISTVLPGLIIISARYTLENFDILGAINENFQPRRREKTSINDKLRNTAKSRVSRPFHLTPSPVRLNLVTAWLVGWSGDFKSRFGSLILIRYNLKLCWTYCPIIYILRIIYQNNL